MLSAMTPPRVIDCEGRWITPGLIDCHTHLVYAGDRAAEFEMRLARRQLRRDRRAGGGILSTVRARAKPTRKRWCGRHCRASTRCWRKASRPSRSSPAMGWKPPPRSASFAPRAASATSGRSGSDDVPGRPRHTAGIRRDRGSYIDHVIDEMLPAVHAEGLADAVDAFCEGIAFSPARSSGCSKRRASRLAGQAARRTALHPCTAPRWRRRSRAVGRPSRTRRRVRCQGDGEGRHRRGAAARRVLHAARNQGAAGRSVPKASVPMAIATDSNPGTSPLTSLLLTMNMACTLFRLTPEEALPASPVTRPGRLGATATSARSSLASGAISPSGTSSGPPSLSIASASIPCMPASGEASDEPACC